MAARPKSCITADTDVNLDFLTKEEKEALLSKKMDMIRQRNKALTERHKLIEADKKKAEEAGQAVIPTVDSQTLPAEGAPKSRGRGRGQPHNKEGNRPAKERPKSSGDFRDSSNYEPIVDTTDLANYRSKGRGGPHDRDAPNNTPKNKRKPAPKEEATTFPSNFEYEPIIDTKDLDKRFGPLLNALEVGSRPHTDHGNHPGHRHPIWRHEIPDGMSNGRAYKGRLKDSTGPPPDPSFNPLADRRRSDKKEDAVDHRRHPRNYGGSADISRVKQSMKNMREKDKEKPQGNKPLEMVMTGKERKNHEEWKAERDRYDKERILRQMSDAGNWRRAWDADKISLEADEQSASYSSKIEPAKRPAGRIGSGRFDRGERDDRPRSAVIGKGTLQNIDHSSQQQRQQQHHHDQQPLQAQVHSHHPQFGDNKTSRPRGRGRGRGRGRIIETGEKFPRPRTWSGGDDRFVECQKELLLVKFDNTAGDNSVEVEYDDDEFLASPTSSQKSPPSGTTPGRGPTGRTPNQAAKQQPRGGKQQQQRNKSPRLKDGAQAEAHQSPIEDKWNGTASSPINIDQAVDAYDTDEARVRTASHSQSYGDSEDWEDCTESSGMREEEDFSISDLGLSGSTTDNSLHDMHLECRLNPEAPEFLPSSPDLVKTPLTHTKALPLVTNGNLSCPSIEGYVISAQPLSPRLSTSPQPHPTTHYPRSSAKTLQWKDEADIVSESNASLSPDDLSVSQNSPVKQTDDEDDDDDDMVDNRKTNKPPLSSEIPMSVEGSPELKDGSRPCLTTTKDTVPSSDTLTDVNPAFDASNRLKEGRANTSNAASPQTKTTVGHSSAFLDKGFLQTSSTEESKDTSKESATSLATEITQEGVVAKGLSREVSRTHDPAEGSLKPAIACTDRAMNGDASGKHMLNEESSVSDDHTLVTFSDKEYTTKIPNEVCNKQGVQKEPSESVPTTDMNSSAAAVPARPLSFPTEDQPASPTADVSASS